MRRCPLRLLASLALVACSACGTDPSKVEVPGHDGTLKTGAPMRAERRAYDGAPPTIPHGNFGIECTECHNLRGIDVPDVGFAPPTPHGRTIGLSALSRCNQCHVFRTTEGNFVETSFEGLAQDLRHGRRLHGHAPPTIPHKVFMRENCAACHSGPAAREEIRTSHPERVRCVQCHVEVVTRAAFEGLGGMQ